MPSNRPFFTAVVVALLFVTAVTPANALLFIIKSLDRIPFPASDAPETRQQAKNALQLKECQFSQGYWINGNITLSYQGQTAPLNEMIRLLSECPKSSVEVSFKKLDADCDWQVTRFRHAPRFDVIVNLNSQNIAFEELMIPSNTTANVAPPSK